MKKKEGNAGCARWSREHVIEICMWEEKDGRREKILRFLKHDGKDKGWIKRLQGSMKGNRRRKKEIPGTRQMNENE